MILGISRSPQRRAALGAALVVGAVVFAATATAGKQANAINDLPVDIQPWYQGLAQNIGPSAYVSWRSPHKPPYVIGYASTYAGNTWRAEVMKRVLNVLLPKYRKAGLVSKVLVTQSNYNTAVQIQQMKQLRDEGADIIFTCCPTPTGLNNAITEGYKAQVPFVSFSGDVTSPYAINTGVNFWLGGYNEGLWLAQRLKGKGNVLLVSGINGNNASDGFDRGVQRAFKKFPGIKMVGTVEGQWTDQVAKTEVLKFLSTNPTKIDGAVVQSAEGSGVIQAWLQSGRPVPPMAIGDEAGAACYWRQHPNWIDRGFHIWPPGDEGQFAFEVMVRTLLGQGPLIASLTRPQGTYNWNFVKSRLPANCAVTDTGWLQPSASDWMRVSTLNKFFKNGYDPLQWKRYYK